MFGGVNLELILTKQKFFQPHKLKERFSPNWKISDMEIRVLKISGLMEFSKFKILNLFVSVIIEGNGNNPNVGEDEKLKCSDNLRNITDER